MSAPLGVLRRIAGARPTGTAEEHCDMCGSEVVVSHSHVVDVRTRSLLCTCRPCYLLFTHDDADLTYRSVPDRYRCFPDFTISSGQWDDLAIPVSVAFFFSHSSLGRVVAFYPSPAGATESELSMAAWTSIVAANPGLATVQPDVEAILVRKEGEAFRAFLVPVDACYELVGHLRRLWRGFDGGPDARHRLAEFFDGIAAKCTPVADQA